MSKETTVPDGFGIETPEWHLNKITEFTKLKQQIGEPSPHLTVVGYLCQDLELMERVWLIGCYAATYCLPSAQVIFAFWSHTDVRKRPDEFQQWLTENWKGIVTRTERRTVRTAPKMAKCLVSYANWQRDEFPRIRKLKNDSSLTDKEYYDIVWESSNQVWSFGRYIVIRMIEGLRRYCAIPAQLYDLRSIGGWSPKKCLCYLYPDYADVILKDDKEGNRVTNELFEDLLTTMRKKLPSLDYYVLAAMLCEYKGAYENHHQYVGWTIDQEPLLYDKVIAYWGKELDPKELWEARAASFPRKVLGEFGGWNGTRWELAKILRDYGYNWSDLKYDYVSTLKSGDFSKPVRWHNGTN
jgi:hypothetical protein